jgi:secreted trypsin-like serine protease
MSTKQFRRMGLQIASAALLCWLSDAAAAQTCRGAAPAPRPKVVGGDQAEIGNWPGQAVLRLHVKNAKHSLYLCGATAISDRWLVTAAHCFDGVQRDLRGTYQRGEKTLTGTLEAVLGVHDLNAVRDEHVYAVEKVIKREGYKEATKTGRDIALIRLKRPYAGPVSRLSLEAATDPKTPPGAQVRVAGFGKLDNKAPTNTYRRADGHEYFAGSQRLMEADIPTVATSTCKSRYPQDKIDDEQLCAGLELGGKDSCRGDSGGPLVAFDRNGCPYQVAVVSWGVGCAGARDYGVYTRISHHADWIKSNAGTVKAVTPSDVQAPSAETAAVAREFTHRARSQLEEILATAKGRVQVGISGGNRVPLGKEVAFVVQSNVAGRLILVDINASGEVMQVLPNKYTPAHSVARMTPGKSVTVPEAAGYGFSGFKAVEPLGKGQLIALVVPEGFQTEALLSEKPPATRGLVPVNTPSNYLMNLVQQVANLVSLRSGDMKDWGLGIAEYEIVK